MGRVIGAGAAELGKELDQVQPLLGDEAVDEAGGHEGAGVGALGDVLGGDGNFLVGGVAEENLGAGFAGDHAAQFAAVFGREHDGMIAFLDFGVRIKQRFDNVIGRGAGADAGEVGTDL